MDDIRAYLLSVIAAALICSIISAIPGKNGMVASTVKLLSGIFMAITLISPLTSIHIPNLSSYLDAFKADAAEAVLAGEKMTNEAATAIIKAETEAYILDKAEEMGASLQVEVSLSEHTPTAPCAVQISGMVSPYTKQRLMEMIEQDLGISREEQYWINGN